MKKTIFALLLLACCTTLFSQPKIKQLSFPSTAELYGLYEISFVMDDYDNPFDPEVIHAYAEFMGPDSLTFTVDAFFYEGYGFEYYNNKYELATPITDDKGWRVRFTPTAPGDWTFRLHAADGIATINIEAFNNVPLRFHVNNVASAKGFISKANTRYLKRSAVSHGRLHEEPFFPVGPNIAWYTTVSYSHYSKAYGIYEYRNYIDKLAGNANYMRIWINRYQYLSLYGPENTELVNGFPKMYFDNGINQKDAAELDYIIQYAMKNDIAIMPCIFNFRNFQHLESCTPATLKSPGMVGDWINNPFHTVLGLSSPYQFFTNPEAKRIVKNLLRYTVARWGYATNILAWELWNEVANMAGDQPIDEQTQQDIIDWHDEMADFIRSVDPYHHLISTSTGNSKWALLFNNVFHNLDFTQNHNYQNIQKASSNEQFSAVLLRVTKDGFERYTDKPFFMGEFGFGQNNPAATYNDKDPLGVDLHNSLWSSAFSGAMGPASFWYWNYLKDKDLFKRHAPILVFLSSLPMLSDTFQPATTGKAKGHNLFFPNHLETYYMINQTEDTLIGWSQDTAFCYQSLRRLTDPVGNNRHFVDGQVNDPSGYVYMLDASKRPKSSARDNTITIPLSRSVRRSVYTVRWYDAETGLEIPEEATTVVVRGRWLRQRQLAFEFPSSIRNPQSGSISNTFGDAVFMVTKVQ